MIEHERASKVFENTQHIYSYYGIRDSQPVDENSNTFRKDAWLCGKYGIATSKPFDSLTRKFSLQHRSFSKLLYKDSVKLQL